MARNRCKRAVLCFFLALTVLIAVPVIATMRIVRQERLDQALIVAVKANDTRRVVALLNRGADANARDDGHPSVTFWQRLTSLFRGSKHRPSPNPTALLLATRSPSRDIRLIQALLEHTADPNLVPDPYETPLTDAIAWNDSRLIGLLLEYGADANPPQPFCGPLPLAAKFCKGKLNVLENLLQHGASVNQLDDREDTALIVSAFENNVPAIRLLLAHHADVTVQGYHGMTALVIAIEIQSEATEDSDRRDARQIILLLKAAGARK